MNHANVSRAEFITTEREEKAMAVEAMMGEREKKGGEEAGRLWGGVLCAGETG